MHPAILNPSSDVRVIVEEQDFTAVKFVIAEWQESLVNHREFPDLPSKACQALPSEGVGGFCHKTSRPATFPIVKLHHY